MGLVKQVPAANLFANGCEALRFVFASFQKSAKAERDLALSETCLRASLVLVFRAIAERDLRDRGIAPAGTLASAETGLFEFDEFFERHLSAGIALKLEKILAPISDLNQIGDLYNELQALRIVGNGGTAILTSSDSHKKRLGSYFTHASLTNLISEGVVQALGKKIEAGEDWSTFTFCDNSCGSGHVLRKILEDLAADFFARGFFGSENEARRWLAEHSLYGIDRDPFAVWLTRLTTALQTAENGKPFVSLGRHVVLGDALISSVEFSDRKFSYANAFPEIFAEPAPSRRGFTVIAGNPPWETIEPRVQDFYKTRTGASKSPSRKEIDRWLDAEAGRRRDYEAWAAKVQSYADDVRASGYGQKSRKVFTYAYFIERSLQTLRTGGLLSYVVKLGLYGDLEAAGLRRKLFRENRTNSLWIFRANKIGGTKIFPRVDPNEKFVVFETEKTGEPADAIRAKSVASMDDLNRDFKPWQCYDVSDLDESDKIEIYETEIQKNVARKARRLPTLKDHGKVVTQELNLTLHRDLFREGREGIPVYRGDDLKPFALAGYTFVTDAREKLKTHATASRDRIGVNDIIPNSRRKLKASFVPALTLTANSILVIDGFEDDDDLFFTLGAMNSFLTEYVLRPRLSNMHLNVFRLNDLPLPADPRIKTEIARLAARLRRGLFDEGREEYIAIEALMSEAYGLNEAEIRGYLSSFSGVSGSYIDDVLSFAKRRDLRKSG